MLKNANIHISGFADEIGQDFDKQLSVVKELGMNYICVRSAGPKSIAQFSPQEFTDELWTKMQAAGVGMSSVGSPIGKVGVNDEEGFALHLQVLENLCEICKIADCKYIRIFSFYIPEGEDPDSYHDVVIAKLKQFVEIAERHGVTLIHENEKDIYGDTAPRCRALFDAAQQANALPKIILYSLNETDLLSLAALCGSFQGGGVKQRMTLGCAWWFNDQFDGMKRQLTVCAEQSLLGNFTGMLTDSRSFLSYPRHEYFRRVLCHTVGEWVEQGRLPEDEEYLGGIIEDICYNNAHDHFGFYA